MTPTGPQDSSLEGGEEPPREPGWPEPGGGGAFLGGKDVFLLSPLIVGGV